MKITPAFYKSNAFRLIIIALVCFIYYGNSIPNKYAFDDFIVITQNQFTQAGVEGIPNIFKYDSWVGCFGQDPKYVVGGRYRPLSLATFALEIGLFGQNPHVSHFNNILLFILTAFLLYLTISKIFSRLAFNDQFFNFPFLAALLFIAHPVHTEVVANIKGRDELLALAGSLAAILFVLKYIDTRKLVQLFWAFICFLAALFSKENAITFLAIIPLSIYFYKNEKPISYLYALLPLVVASAIFFSARHFALAGIAAPPATFITDALINASFTEKFATIFYAMGLYIKLLFFPHPLTIDYYPNHIAIVSWTNILVVLSFLVYLALMVFAFLNLKKRTVLSYAILMYLIPLSIVSNLFFPIGGVIMSERFIFISSIGFVLAIAWFLTRFVFEKPRGKYLKISLVTFIMLLCFIKTYSRNKVWMDDFTLFTTDVKTSVNSRKSNLAVSVVLIERAALVRDPELALRYRSDALIHAKKVVSLFPNYVDGIYQLGNAYAENNMPDSAMLCYKNSIQQDPSLNNIIGDKVVAVLDLTSNTEFKLKYYQEFLKLSPNNFNLNYQLGYTYGRYINDLGQSAYYLSKALEIQPDNMDANKNLGLVYRLSGQYEKSASCLEKAVSINAYDISAWQSLYLTYQLAGNTQKENEVLKVIENLSNNN